VSQSVLPSYFTQLTLTACKLEHYQVLQKVGVQCNVSNHTKTYSTSYSHPGYYISGLSISEISRNEIYF